ncbi:MAG: BPSS1780 family membrane protein [Halofilum sp. (in: g-proteobacteria)]|nr:BPSS1780 family membrane protein [Halofilum sp. (in: g-proteobacteria)]
MTHQTVSAGSGWNWIAQGWGTFIKSALLWIVVALIFAVVYFVLSLVPIIGALAAALLAPALFGGMVYGARELEQGRALEVGHLFQAFRVGCAPAPWCCFGLVPLGAAIVMGLIMALVIGGAIGAATAHRLPGRRNGHGHGHHGRRRRGRLRRARS